MDFHWTRVQWESLAKSMTLIQRRINVVCPVGFQRFNRHCKKVPLSRSLIISDSLTITPDKDFDARTVFLKN